MDARELLQEQDWRVPRGYYSSTQAQKIVGITYRQLDYWSNHFLPDQRTRHYGSGSIRYYSPGEIETLKALKMASHLRGMSLPDLAIELTKHFERRGCREW